MRGQMAAALYALLFLALCLSLTTAQSVDPIVIKGSKFFYKTNGTEFFIKGVAYQEDGYFATYTSGLPIIDPFSDGPTCARDIPYLQQADINVVRAYAVDPTEDHSACMAEMANAGIYVLMDLTGNQKEQKINTTIPYWDYLLYDRMTSVVDAFHNYTNVLGFFVGTEVINATYTDPAPYVKAAARDVKAYIRKHRYREIPVGYATGDDSEVRQTIAAYLNCGSNQQDAIDFLGLNIYSWCGDSTLTLSGYSDRIDEFRNYSIPIFLSEFGCNSVTPRKFGEVQAIYGDEMASVFSGGIAYQYFHDNENYGLVDVYGDTVTTSADYSYLSKAMNTATPSGTARSAYSPTNVPLDCPTTDDTWQPVPTLPPTPYARLCTCMMNSLTCISPTVQNDTSIGDQGITICGNTPAACDGIASYVDNGTYGAYSVCNSTELASWVFNQYYISKGRSRSACTSLGGIIKEPVSQRAADCNVLLQQAGTDGTGTITTTPSPPAAAATDNSSGGSSAGSSSGDASTNSSGSDGSSGGDGGLSGGAIAGIVIGALAVLAIIATLSYFLWRARRKNRPAAAAEASSNVAEKRGPEHQYKAELPADSRTPYEAEGHGRAEIDGLLVGHDGTKEYYKQGHEGAQGQYQAPVELPAPHGVNEAGIMSPTDTAHR